MSRLKIILAALILIALNIGVGSLVLLATSSGTLDAKRETVCDSAALNALQKTYVDLVGRRAADLPIDLGLLRRTREELAALIVACYEGYDVNRHPYHSGGIRLYEPGGIAAPFVLRGTKWGANSPFNPLMPPVSPGGTVTYSFMPSGAVLEPISITNPTGPTYTNVAITSLPTYQACFLPEIRNAFAAWEAVSDINFQEVTDTGTAFPAVSPNAQGHIRIGGHIFDGSVASGGGTLAHAFFPPPNGGGLAGDLHFDIAENWQCTTGAGQFDIGLVALHEVGHAIGLDHEPVALAVMNAFYNASLTGLQPDDIGGAVSIYGSNPSVIAPIIVTAEVQPSAAETNVLGAATLEVRLLNPNTIVSLTSVNVSSVMPSGVTLIPSSLSHDCAGGTSNTTTGQLRLSGITVGGNTDCAITIDVTVANALTNIVQATATALETGSTQAQSQPTSVRGVTPATGQYCATTHDAGWSGPRVIPDNNPTGITSTITLPDNFTLTDLNVYVNMTHTWVGDVEIYLTRGATSIRLLDEPVNNTGTCSSNNVFNLFDDEASLQAQLNCITNNTNADAYTPGAALRPAQALTAFDGQTSSGAWALRIVDRVSGDSGHLLNWCLQTTAAPPTRLGFLAAPTHAAAGGVINPSGGVRVQLLDANNIPVPDNGVQVTLALNDPNQNGGILSSPGSLTQTTVGGVATFTGLNIAQWGSGYTLTATAPGLTSATSPAFNITPAPNYNLLRNGGFGFNMTHWGTWATPNLTDIVYMVENGVFNYYRQPNSISAVVLQNTTVALPAGTPLTATFDLANTSSTRKRVMAMLHDNNFTDFQVCVFWLAPGATMRTYEMRSRSEQAWQNGASFSLYLSPGDGQGYVRVDNASLVYSMGQADESTACFDPDAPAPGSGPDGAEMIANGGFSSGFTSWGSAFQITTNVNAQNVLEFYGTLTPGDDRRPVVLQYTGQTINANTPFEVRFQMGNSSPNRKRAVVLIHNDDFTDLQTCTFWLNPNTPLGNYGLRTYLATTVTNATLAFYVASPDGVPAYLLDNVSMIVRPSLPVSGTECVQGSMIPPLMTGTVPEGAGQMPTLMPTATATPIVEVTATEQTPLPSETPTDILTEVPPTATPEPTSSPTETTTEVPTETPPPMESPPSGGG